MNVDLVELLTHPAFMLIIILVLDLIFGDPVYRFHPVRMIGSMISWHEAVLRHSGLNGKFGGVLLSLLLFIYYCANPIESSTYNDLNKTWQFRISYLDYYLILNSNEVTDLNTLRDTYFSLNTFEFYIVNFSLFYGLVASIILCFLIQRVFSYLNYSQIINIEVLKKTQGGFFIRNQNFMTQQNTSATVRSWVKSKKKFK